MNLDDYKVEILTEEDLDYVFSHLDELTQDVFGRLGYVGDNYKYYMALEHKWTVKYKGVPFFAFGFKQTAGCNQHWFIGTTEIRRHVRFMHQHAPRYLNTVRTNYPAMSNITEISERKSNIFNWLGHVGFEFTQYVTGEPGNRLVLMEWR